MDTGVLALAKRAKAAARDMAAASGAQRDRALRLIAQRLEENTALIADKNREDIENARAAGLRESMIDRLTLTPERILAIADATRQVSLLADPLGHTTDGSVMPSGVRIYKTSVPLGVVAMIYEARPNVTVDAAALCIKSGNCALLRGGKEAIHTNLALAAIMRDAVREAGLPEDCVLLVSDTSRRSAEELMGLTGFVDVLIPRGGAGLIQTVVKNARVPVIETGAGNCHLYAEASADIGMAVALIDNAKTQRPSVCNAIETLLVHRDIAPGLLPLVKQKLDAHSVELRGCPETLRILGESVRPATEEDYATEFVDYILAVRVVDSTQEAIAHITQYGTMHSECIVTESYSAAREFTERVDAAAVYVNASTRFTDGGEFGLGAEIGISTQKLHARGPMGLAALTSVKYILMGDGQVRE